MRGEVPETPKPGDPIFRHTQNLIVGSNRLAVDACATKARELGFRTLILSTFVQGETRDVASVHAAIAKEMLASGCPVKPPACVISGGETTVTLKGSGKGGRNQEFALAAAIELAGLPDVLVLSGGTDGSDGPTDAAGAVADAVPGGNTGRRESAKRRLESPSQSHHPSPALHVPGSSLAVTVDLAKSPRISRSASQY
jgi:hydroxypyruvate reductase